MFHNELKSALFFGDFSSFSGEYSKAIKIIGEYR
jgi:hypothetical protein